MSSIVSNIQGFVQKNSEMFKIAVIILLVGLAVYYLGYYKENLYMQDYHKFDAESRDGKLPLGTGEEEVQGARKKKSLSYGVHSPSEKEKTEVNAEDLLPQTDLDGAFKDDTDILMGNFVTPGVTYGIDTVGSSLKKANYAIRSMPQIPVNREVSPWNLSSYEPDVYRKPIE